LTYISWINANIFNFRKGDSIAYLSLYIVIPVIITWISLQVLPMDNISIIYCYLTILISSLNSIYDSANRWNSATRSVYNLKLFIIMLSNLIITIYCFYVVMYILISQSTNCRCDWILFSYIFAIIISLVDAINCFTNDIIIHEP